MLAYAASKEPDFASLITGIGAVGAVLLALVLARRMDDLLPWALILLGIAYTVSLLVHGSGVDGGAPLVAAGLLICAELAVWSLDEEHAIAAERAVVVARGTALGALVAVSTAAAALVVAASLAPGSGLAWTALGAAASVLVVGLAVRLARRTAQA
ncbi:MAG TPA: hypothetical protein VF327_01235 [Gaiellaceae bacterium]